MKPIVSFYTINYKELINVILIGVSWPKVVKEGRALNQVLV